jgi:hypothetical protein
MNDLHHAGQSDRPIITTLSALRTRHGELLKRLREEGDSRRFSDDVAVFIRAGHEAGAFLLGHEERWEAQGLLDYWANRSYSEGFEPPNATLAEFDLQRAPQLSDDRCPYVGLNAFHEEQHSLFFGRDRLLRRLTDLLGESRFLAVTGSSGSGKSSLVLGGFVPLLKAGAVPGSERWRYLRRALVPGSDPLCALARLLSESFSADEPALAEALMSKRH